MSILSNIIAEVDKRQKESNSKSQLYDLEKTIREMAKSKGLMPRNFLIKIAEQNPKIANNRIIQHLIGEQDVPTQKGRDAKPEVLTKRAMNVVKKSIKHSANKQRRRMDKDSVSEDEAQDRGYAQMIIQQHQDEYKKFMDTGDLIDAPTIYEKLFAYFSSSDADDMMPYGTMKARDGDPYVWLVNKLDELGLIIEEGNEFAQKVRQLKATGAKKGTKFKTSDGEEHTLEGDLNAWYAEQYAKELAEKDGKAWDRMSYGDKEDYRKIANKKYGVVKSEDIEGLVEKMVLVKDQVADAVAERVKYWAKSASVEQINKVLTMIKSPAKLKPEGPTSASIEEDKTDAEIDAFHRELDQLMHKHFGHSSDEKKEKVKEDAITEEEFDEAAGKKDACYHKVKSRYKVWPSAYASGALVQCRKVGASNWGNKSK